MADRIFQIKIVYPSVGAWSVLDDPTVKSGIRSRVSALFDAVTNQSKDPDVKAGFNVTFIAVSDTDAFTDSSKLDPTTVRAVIVPGKIVMADILQKVKKQSPHASQETIDFIQRQISTEGGAGGRDSEGSEHFAVATTEAWEKQALFKDKITLPNKSEFARQFGTEIAHELGHALGIKKNQGNGVMNGTVYADMDNLTRSSTAVFEPPDAKIILATLEAIAKARRPHEKAQHSHPH
jgi:hypothetical protein